MIDNEEKRWEIPNVRLGIINLGGLQNETLRAAADEAAWHRATSEKSSLAHPSGRRKERRKEGVD